jgi:hypothetical protein
MRQIALLLVAAALAGCATTAPPAPVEGDDFQIRATVLAVYNVVSGPAGRRDWNRFEELFAPSGRLVDATATALTTKEYVELTKPKLNEQSLFERPVDTKVDLAGNIAHVWSRYEARATSNQEQPSSRGVDSFELVRIGNDWKVLSRLRQPEDAPR